MTELLVVLSAGCAAIGLAGIVREVESTGKLAGVTRRLRQAGWPPGIDAAQFVTLRIIGTVGAGWLAVAAGLPLHWAVAAAVGAFALAGTWLRETRLRRTRQIEYQLPLALDTLALCVTAGLDFNRAMDVFLESYRDGALADELGRVRGAVRLGAPRSEALRTMADELESLPVALFVSELVQSERTGGALAEFLRRGALDLRAQRLQQAEHMAQIAPLRVAPALVFCGLPCMGIVILAPVFIRASQQIP